MRELLCGSTRFGDLRRGIPRISRTMLSARLRELLEAGVIARHDGEQDAGYQLTAAGLELAAEMMLKLPALSWTVLSTAPMTSRPRAATAQRSP
jgi:DNA-binding HxlR family transcriptional regulator